MTRHSAAVIVAAMNYFQPRHLVRAFVFALFLAGPATAQAANVTEISRDDLVLEITDVSDSGAGHAQDLTITEIFEDGKPQLRLTGDDATFMVAGTNPAGGGPDCTGFDIKDEQVVTCRMPQKVLVNAGGKDDEFKAATGLSIPVEMQGGPGNDELKGGALADELNGGSGDDRLDGDDGDDLLIGSSNADHLVGGRGDHDIAFYETDRAEGVRVTIGDGSPNDGNAVLDQSVVPGPAALDEVTGSVEVVDGTKNADLLTGTLNGPKAETLRGNAGDDALRGNAGNDRLEGGTGSDQLLGNDGDDHLVGGTGGDTHSGGAGIDTADYSDHRFPVAVTIGTVGDQDGNPSEDIGNGDENVPGDVENVIGSAALAPDKITGTAANELLSGLAGNDVLDGGLGRDTYLGGNGDDTIRARDGVADGAIDCGAGPGDTAIVDAIDPPTVNCENVDRPAAPGPGSGPGAGRAGNNPADASLDLTLVAKGRQRLARKKALILRFRCPKEACRVTVGATLRIGKRKLKLKGVRRSLRAGQAATVKLKLTKRQLRALRKGLKARKRVRVDITATGLDAAGNRARLTRSVKGVR